MTTFAISGDQFVFEGKPIRLLSGALHYFRVVPEYWMDRLMKLKVCGFNSVETYIPWNLHEPVEGRFNFEGIADVVRFIQLAQELELLVIIRPSPYICAEWEFGGLPAWLLSDSNMKLRCYDRPYLDKVDAYYDELLPKLKPLLCTNGGPIIAMQVENEYGSYGNDSLYMEYIRQGMINRGMDVLLFTSDGPADSMLQGGSLLPQVLATVNFGSKPEEGFAKLEEYQSSMPVMCMEYWNGWFDHWGEEHHVREYDEVAVELDRMLELGASVNFYMFHGGTNFGFYNGANYFDKYEPTVTSYDYNALLNESGDLTDKYWAIREVISKHVALPDIQLPEPISKVNYGQVRLTHEARLFNQLSNLSIPITRACPEPMEKLGQDYGLMLYQTSITGPRPNSKLFIQEVRDRALVFLDEEYKGTIDRNHHQLSLEIEEHDITVEIPESGAQLCLLVENMGRVNYGWMLRDPKGITEGVRLEKQFLYHWTMHPLPLNDLSPLEFTPIQDEEKPSPTFYKGTFQVNDVGDTFLKLEGWTKGVAYINGFNLGRYWNEGPQRTLYVPAPLLRVGDNEIILFELHGKIDPVVTFQDFAELG